MHHLKKGSFSITNISHKLVDGGSQYEIQCVQSACNTEKGTIVPIMRNSLESISPTVPPPTSTAVLQIMSLNHQYRFYPKINAQSRKILCQFPERHQHLADVSKSSSHQCPKMLGLSPHDACISYQHYPQKEILEYFRLLSNYCRHFSSDMICSLIK